MAKGLSIESPDDYFAELAYKYNIMYADKYEAMQMVEEGKIFRDGAIEYQKILEKTRKARAIALLRIEGVGF